MEKTNRSTGILLKKIQIIGNSFKNLGIKHIGYGTGWNQ